MLFASSIVILSLIIEYASSSKVSCLTSSTPKSGKLSFIYPRKNLFGAIIKNSSGLKVSSYVYIKYAILCIATVVFPDPATPWTINGLNIFDLIILFCFFWIVATIFLSLLSDFSFKHSCNNSSFAVNVILL